MKGTCAGPDYWHKQISTCLYEVNDRSMLDQQKVDEVHVGQYVVDVKSMSGRCEVDVGCKVSVCCYK